jgi:hypothetical protein
MIALMLRNLQLLHLFSSLVLAQSIPALPFFGDYPAKQIYKGIPTLPKLDKSSVFGASGLFLGSSRSVSF